MNWSICGKKKARNRLASRAIARYARMVKKDSQGTSFVDLRLQRITETILQLTQEIEKINS